MTNGVKDSLAQVQEVVEGVLQLQHAEDIEIFHQRTTIDSQIYPEVYEFMKRLDIFSREKLNEFLSSNFINLKAGRKSKLPTKSKFLDEKIDFDSSREAELLNSFFI